MMMTLGERIRELREAKDISLRELAKLAGGLSAAFLSDIEFGRRYPSEDVLVKLAGALGVAAEELRKLDSRSTIKDLKAMSEANPAYGIALRRMIDKGLTAEELMDLVQKKRSRSKAE